MRKAIGAIWCACVLLVAALAVWLPGLSGPYQFDDFATPLGDPASQSLSAWAKHLSVTLRPVTKLTYALEAEAGYTEPAPRRIVSILLHAATAALLFLLLARLEPRAVPVAAALAAGLWLVHPVHAESVVALCGRTAVLAGLFLVAAMLAIESRRRWLAALLFLLACLSRETALAGLLPLAVLVWSREEPQAYGHRARLVAFWPLLASGAAALLWFLTTPRYLELAEYSYLGRPFWKSLFAQVGAVPVGLGLLARPSRLSIDYGVPLPDDASDPLFLLGIAAYAGAVAGVLLLARRSRCAAVGLALWLAALLPTQSVVPKLDALSNRPLSLALAGLLLALAPLFPTAKDRASSPWLARGMATGAAAILLALGISASARARLYQSEMSLWADAASKSRVNARPHFKFAMLLKEQGRHREAWQEIQLATAIDPFSSRIAALARAYRIRPREEVP